MKILRNTLAISFSTAFLAACSETSVSEVSPEIVEPKVKREVVENTSQLQSTPTPKTVVKDLPTVKVGALTSIDMGRLYTMKEAGEVILIDVRPPIYHGLGNIPGSKSLPLIKYDKLIAEKRPLLDSAIESGKVIVLYCQNIDCPDAHKTGVRLTKLGYSVSTYSGGWEEWKESGL